jgi:hypothetical protein
MSDTTMREPTVLFEESQRTSSNVAAFVAAMVVIALVSTALAALRHGQLASAAPGLLLGALITGGVTLVVAATRLETRVTTESAVISYRPFKTLTLAPSDIGSVTVRTFGLFDGGIGYHVGFKSMALTAATGSGVQITRPDGRRILIGTRRPDALLSALMQLARGAAR